MNYFFSEQSSSEQSLRGQHDYTASFDSETIASSFFEVVWKEHTLYPPPSFQILGTPAQQPSRTPAGSVCLMFSHPRTSPLSPYASLKA